MRNKVTTSLLERMAAKRIISEHDLARLIEQIEMFEEAEEHEGGVVLENMALEDRIRRLEDENKNLMDIVARLQKVVTGMLSEAFKT